MSQALYQREEVDYGVAGSRVRMRRHGGAHSNTRVDGGVRLRPAESDDTVTRTPGVSAGRVVARPGTDVRITRPARSRGETYRKPDDVPTAALVAFGVSVAVLLFIAWVSGGPAYL